MKVGEIQMKTGFSRGFIEKWKDSDSLEDAPRNGRPNEVLTRDVMQKLEKNKLKKGVSTRKLSKEFGDRGRNVSKSSVMFANYIRRISSKKS